MSKQTTISKSISLSGVGIHTGKEVTLTFKPAPENYGYAFCRVDLPISNGTPGRTPSIQSLNSLI